MKLFSYFIIASCIGFVACNNQPNNAALLPTDMVNNPRSADDANEEGLKDLGKLIFTDTLHDFGKLKEGDVVEFGFAYSNKGKNPILINDASSTCGCTVPEYKHDPIMNDEKGEIKVKFNSAGKHGMIDKTITIFTNGNPSEYYLKITAEVE
jgi:Protein of unknown function (DUF1573)